MPTSGNQSHAQAITDFASALVPPVVRDVQGDAEHGRGLRIVAALSTCWNWAPHGTGKVVYAILARQG